MSFTLLVQVLSKFVLIFEVKDEIEAEDSEESKNKKTMRRMSTGKMPDIVPEEDADMAAAEVKKEKEKSKSGWRKKRMSKFSKLHLIS